jgi:hypothetical protein
MPPPRADMGETIGHPRHETAAAPEALNALLGECQIPHGRRVLVILIFEMSFRDSSADKGVRNAD